PGESVHYQLWSASALLSGATATLSVSAGDVLYAYIYLDPVYPPTELMLKWNDGSWEHRAYWGANNMLYGTDGTSSRRYMGPLPAVGQWVQLKVPASEVSLEGSTLTGMAFTLYNGRATWDAAGRLGQAVTGATPTVTVAAPYPVVVRGASQSDTFTLTRTGDLSADLAVNYTLAGTAVSGVDYHQSAPAVFIPAGSASASLSIQPLPTTNLANQTIVLELTSNPTYI